MATKNPHYQHLLHTVRRRTGRSLKSVSQDMGLHYRNLLNRARQGSLPLVHIHAILRAVQLPFEQVFPDPEAPPRRVETLRFVAPRIETLPRTPKPPIQEPVSNPTTTKKRAEPEAPPLETKTAKTVEVVDIYGGSLPEG